VVEESLSEIPAWHPQVARVIPLALRRWRKQVFSSQTRHEWRAFRSLLQEQNYDLILDAQGLIKSAFLGYFAKGKRCGLDFASARESFASFAYQKHCTVNFHQHAIIRLRSLFSEALDFPLPQTPPDFGFKPNIFLSAQEEQPYVVFLHGTTWTSKEWPEAYWIELAELFSAQGLGIKISGGNALEVARAERIAASYPKMQVLPYLRLSQMAALLAKAQAAIAVDTGFGHLAAALNVPTVSLYGATNALYTGAIGKASLHLSADFACSPCLKRQCSYQQASKVSPACYAALTPTRVFSLLKQKINAS
jgi:heptosyltransferase I